MSSSSFTNIMTAIMAASAVVVAVASVRRDGRPEPPIRNGATRAPGEVKEWRLIAEGGTWMGQKSAAVVVTEFSDFQCPFCKRLADSLAVLRTRYRGQVAISYRHFPIERIHPHARQAALAAECSAAQGRFEPMHDALYSSPDSIGRASWREFARKAGVPNLASFEKCLSDSVFAGRLAQDFAAGQTLKLTGTPTVLINEVRLVGTPSLFVLDSVVRDQLRRKGIRN